MEKYGHLLKDIADALDIRKGNKESDLDYKGRIMYSAWGHMTLASLYDVMEDNVPVSVVHFNQRFLNLFDSYLEMYPETRGLFSTSREDLKDKVYRIYHDTGHFYHTPHRIAPAIPASACEGDITFFRGSPITEGVKRSGLGSYYAKSIETPMSLNDMFHLPKSSLKDRWEMQVKNAKWRRIDFPVGTEFLRMAPPFTRGYWDKTMASPDVASLARTGTEGAQLYYIYRRTVNGMEAMQLPEWSVEKQENRTLSNECLAYENNLPPTKYHLDGPIVRLKLQYLLPPKELTMIQLYSWPRSFQNITSPFNYIMDKRIFFSIKEVLELIGYQFVEE